MAGNKTETRRTRGLSEINKSPDDWSCNGIYCDEKGIGRAVFSDITDMANVVFIKNPYGNVGDLIWIRESWKINSWDFEDGTIVVKYANGDRVECVMRDAFDNTPFTAEWLQFQLDAMAEKGIFKIVDKDEKPTLDDDEFFYKRTGKEQPFKPSIHMPKEAARIWLQIESVSIERLHDISEESAIKEGIHSFIADRENYGARAAGMLLYKDYMSTHDNCAMESPKDSFFSLWESINGKESLESNPFVWVIKYKVLSTTGRPK